jgi:hypothetical protein
VADLQGRWMTTIGRDGASGRIAAPCRRPGRRRWRALDVGSRTADDVRDWTTIGVIVCAASILMWTLLLV